MYSIYGIWKHFHYPLKEETAPHKFRFFAYYIPILLAGVSFLIRFEIVLDDLSLIIPAFTFFVGLLTTSVIFLLRYSDTNNPKKNLIDQTRNISIYLIVTGILIVGIALTGYISSPELVFFDLQTRLYSSFTLFLLSHYFFVVLLLPARIFVIIEDAAE